ncbi:unnamed protein product [Protopolystoma xenopodis]|uniref:Uncharacterized protein n=1 Tax=Protopolystoma xenopodis TaxID=117903 RepID=A0A3S5AWY5_9PLAT|nr:unnamed protein product [Protopolystoma xenopodis]
MRRSGATTSRAAPRHDRASHTPEVVKTRAGVSPSFPPRLSPPVCVYVCRTRLSSLVTRHSSLLGSASSALPRSSPVDSSYSFHPPRVRLLLSSFPFSVGPYSPGALQLHGHTSLFVCIRLLSSPLCPPPCSSFRQLVRPTVASGVRTRAGVVRRACRHAGPRPSGHMVTHAGWRQQEIRHASGLPTAFASTGRGPSRVAEANRASGLAPAHLTTHSSPPDNVSSLLATP